MNVEKIGIFAFLASTIFRVMTNFQIKSSWQTDVLEAYLVSPGSLQQGARVFQTHLSQSHCHFVANIRLML